MTATQPTTRTNSDRGPVGRLPLAVGLDVFVTIAFVAIGRRNHDEDEAISGLIDTAAPFVIGLLLAWAAARIWTAPTTIRTGVIVWFVTVTAGMIARRFVFDDGTALSFVIVATVFLGTFLVGWRAAWSLLRARRSR